MVSKRLSGNHKKIEYEWCRDVPTNRDNASLRESLEGVCREDPSDRLYSINYLMDYPIAD